MHLYHLLTTKVSCPLRQGNEVLEWHHGWIPNFLVVFPCACKLVNRRRRGAKYPLANLPLLHSLIQFYRPCTLGKAVLHYNRLTVSLTILHSISYFWLSMSI